MATAPYAAESAHKAHTAPEKVGALSYTKEKTKQELFQAIDAQNKLHGKRETEVKDRYEEKVAKYMKQGQKRTEAEASAAKQIQKVRARVFKDKLATPGTKQGANHYKDKGDSDGEGAIFLMKKYIFGRKESLTTYLKHHDIEKHAQSSNLKDKNVLKFFLDGWRLPGMTVAPGEGKWLRSPLTQTKVVMDHHPDGPTSTTGMIAKMLEIIHLIPPKDKQAVQKFVHTIDIVDSFLSRAGRAIDVEKDYAKTLASLSYMLDSEPLFNLCEALPENIWPLTPIPDHLLNSIEVISKEKKEKVKLIECVQKKQKNMDTGAKMINEKLAAKQFISIEGKKFLIFGPKDGGGNDVTATLSAMHDYGTIRVFDNGGIFLVHDGWVPSSIRDLGIITRDVIFLLNAESHKNYHDNVKKILDALPESPGKIYLATLLKKNPEVKEEEKPQDKKEKTEIVTREEWSTVAEPKQETKEEIIQNSKLNTQNPPLSPPPAAATTPSSTISLRATMQKELAEMKKGFKSIRAGTKKWVKQLFSKKKG